MNVFERFRRNACELGIEEAKAMRATVTDILHNSQSYYRHMSHLLAQGRVRDDAQSARIFIGV